jgi:hypothetical protein
MALARERPRHGGAVKPVRAWVVDREGDWGGAALTEILWSGTTDLK